MQLNMKGYTEAKGSWIPLGLPKYSSTHPDDIDDCLLAGKIGMYIFKLYELKDTFHCISLKAIGKVSL